MACFLVMLTTSAMPAGLAAAASPTERVIERFLAMVHPEDDPLGEARSARWAVLRELEDHPADTVGAVDAALKRVEDPRQRAELVEVIGKFRRAGGAEAAARAGREVSRRSVPVFPPKQVVPVLARALKDPDERVRFNAIRGLRLLARRVDRSGEQRRQRGPEHEPAAPGLLMHLLVAAEDDVEANRVLALYALADTCEPAAAAALALALNDPSPQVRLQAACLLTEFDNAAGLPEMKRRLGQLGAESDEFLYYRDAGMLLASFERITGKSFGPVPINPGLSSDTREAERMKQRYHELLDTWSAWWAWEPAAATRGNGP
jgi:hypothetical protein